MAQNEQEQMYGGLYNMHQIYANMAEAAPTNAGSQYAFDVFNSNTLLNQQNYLNTSALSAHSAA